MFFYVDDITVSISVEQSSIENTFATPLTPATILPLTVSIFKLLVPFTFKLFEYLYRCSIVELNLIKGYVDKNGYKIINDKFKNTGLSYSQIDAVTYIDYYSDQIDEFISLMDGC